MSHTKYAIVDRTAAELTFVGWDTNKWPKPLRPKRTDKCTLFDSEDQARAVVEEFRKAARLCRSRNCDRKINNSNQMINALDDGSIRIIAVTFPT